MGKSIQTHGGMWVRVSGVRVGVTKMKPWPYPDPQPGYGVTLGVFLRVTCISAVDKITNYNNESNQRMGLDGMLCGG